MKHPKKMTITLTWQQWCLVRALCLDAWRTYNRRRTDDTPQPPTYAEKWLNRADAINEVIEKEGELRGVDLWEMPYE